MRLENVKIHGFRRLVDTGCFISGKLTAFVGPNEAGKSSLLDALLSTNDPDEIPVRDRPRGREPGERDTAIQLRFRLEADDLAALSHISAAQTPAWFGFSMTYGGDVTYWTDPRLTRPHLKRRTAATALRRYANTKAAKSLSRTPDSDGPGDILDAVIALVDGGSDLDEDQAQVVQELAEQLKGDAGLVNRASKSLHDWLAEQQDSSPHATATKILFARRPLFQSFDVSERSLASDYQLATVVASPPAALANLANLGELNLQRLQRAVTEDDVGMVETITEAANARLRSVFENAWTQSPVFVRLKQDASTLRVLVSTEGGGYSSIAERSDGLKTFVALTAFGAIRNAMGRKLILVIDEAEQHLHYDAQADLIRMLDRQQVAAQVLFTTHSAGCLPFDLGTGVRPVLPAGDTGTSRLANNFWTQGPGFTPLLMAMGAAAAAITPSRYAVLTEGATEMLLLPTLVREAVGRERLDYQVAPGIAEASSLQLQKLDIEAARVAYLVDGDDGGANHVRRLAAVGVPAAKILQLGGPGSGLSTEELLQVDVYLDAVNEALVRKHGVGHRIPASNLAKGKPRARSVYTWCRKHGLDPVSKTAVAEALLDAPPGRFLSPEGEKVLRATHSALCATLGLPS